MKKHDKTHGIEDEPHLKEQSQIVSSAAFSSPDCELPNDERMAIESHQDDVLHSIWDERQTVIDASHSLDQKRLTYRVWLAERIARTSPLKSWLTAVLLTAFSGPWAVLGAIIQQLSLAQPLLLLLVIAPISEEIMKAAATLWVVEIRPYLFRSKLQILVTMLAAGFGFAAIENLVYLNIYIPDPSLEIRVWRWTVCVCLHMGCAGISAIGLMRTWDDAIKNRRRPRLTLASPFLISAVVTHALYNAAAIFMPLIGSVR